MRKPTTNASPQGSLPKEKRSRKLPCIRHRFRVTAGSARRLTRTNELPLPSWHLHAGRYPPALLVPNGAEIASIKRPLPIQPAHSRGTSQFKCYCIFVHISSAALRRLFVKTYLKFQDFA